jgi:hypothetical protein
MIKLKILTEKKTEKKKEKKRSEPAYPEIIMLPDVVMEKDKFIKFMKETYNIKVEDEN